mgnify:CR=1 FL=1
MNNREDDCYQFLLCSTFVLGFIGLKSHPNFIIIYPIRQKIKIVILVFISARFETDSILMFIINHSTWTNFAMEK